MIGFVVEGPSDEKIIQEISRKLRINAEIRRPTRGEKIQSPKKTSSYTKDLLYKGCEKVIILKDSHSSNPIKVEEDLRNKLKEESLKDKMDKNVKICIVVHAIESWLLADEKAVGNYLNVRIEKIRNPESIYNPSEKIDKIFKKFKGYKRKYYKGGEDPREIAKRLDLENIMEKCPSFKKFVGILENNCSKCQFTKSCKYQNYI
jgi:hypothetical protein